MSELLIQSQQSGWRRLEDTCRQGAYLSERSVYVDPDTHGIVWRMTCDPAIDSNDYYDKPAWNADGSVICFFSWRSGQRRRWLMNADGSNIRPMPAPADDPSVDGYWSLLRRDRFLIAQVENDTTRVLALNPFDGEIIELVAVEQDLGAMQPPHPSEECFLFGKKDEGYSHEIADHPSMIYVLGLDGSLQTIELERSWHRLRFCKSDDCRIFFNYDQPRTQWTILPDGTERKEIPFTGSHPDWVTGGTELTFFDEGSVWGWTLDSTERREIARLGSGGHGASTVDGDWFVTDTIGGTPDSAIYPNQILAFPLNASSVIQRICTFDNSLYNHHQNWHPDHHTTHAHPTPSPDGTKVVFNSDAIGDFSDLYMAVLRQPDAPRNLRQRIDGKSVVLNWDEPVHSREVMGYNIYRSADGGLTWKLLSFKPQRGLGWRSGLRKDQKLCYAVTAVEHSGLESAPTQPVYQLGDVYWEGPICLRYQAEVGEPTLPLTCLSDRSGASSGAYIGCSGEGRGRLWLPVRVPATRSFYLWARVRGEGSWKATLPDGQIRLVCDSEEWTWVRAEEPHELITGETRLLFQPETGQECLDMIFLADVEDYVPEGRMTMLDGDTPPTPEGLTAEPAFANAIRIAWQELRLNSFSHFNVYRVQPGTEPELTQANLVGSPVEAELVDWGLQPGKTYAYAVTAVNRAGIESLPVSVACDLPAIKSESIELDARKGKRTDMDLVQPDGLDLRAAIASRAEGSITWKFKLAQDGQYALWGISTHQERQPSLFDVLIDDQKVGQWQVWGRWGQWSWSALGSHVAGSPELFDLTEGRHSLTLVPRTATSAVAQVVVTNDPTWWPLTDFSGDNIDVS